MHVYSHREGNDEQCHHPSPPPCPPYSQLVDHVNQEDTLCVDVEPVVRKSNKTISIVFKCCTLCSC